MAQLTITFTIPDAQLQSIKDDYAAQRGWIANIPNPSGSGTIPNPESQNAFIKRDIGEFIKNTVKARRMQAAGDAASAAAASSADANVVLT